MTCAEVVDVMRLQPREDCWYSPVFDLEILRPSVAASIKTCDQFATAADMAAVRVAVGRQQPKAKPATGDEKAGTQAIPE